MMYGMLVAKRLDTRTATIADLIKLMLKICTHRGGPDKKQIAAAFDCLLTDALVNVGKYIFPDGVSTALR